VGVDDRVRWLLVGGCAVFAVGLVLTNAVISPSPAFFPLAAALALTGIGIGTCVVPITSSVLAAVPAERSGMAASATNTSREVGAVIGVAVLGSIVNGRLHTELVCQTEPTEDRALPPANHHQWSSKPGPRRLTEAPRRRPPTGTAEGSQEVLHAAYSAFQSGLHVALYLSAVLMAGVAILALVTLHGRPGDAEDDLAPSPASQLTSPGASSPRGTTASPE